MWWGAEHNDLRMDSRTKLKIEISEKKRGEFVCFGGKGADALKLGYLYIQANLPNQRPPFCVRRMLSPILDQSATSIGNFSILRQTRNR